MTREKLDQIVKQHQLWLESYGEKGSRADLSEANLSWVNLRGADLTGANIDYSMWTLWCGSLDVIVDKRIAAQFAYHFCRLICDDPEVKKAQHSLISLANQFHRVKECGRIEEKGE